MKWQSAVVFLAVVGASLLAEAEVRTWTDSAGRQMQAEFVKLDGSKVYFLKNGTQFEFPFANLSPESRSLVTRLETDRALGFTTEPSVPSAAPATSSGPAFSSPASPEPTDLPASTPASSGESTDQASLSATRNWTHAGRSISGRFVRMHEGEVVIRHANRISKFPFYSLSADDQGFLTEQLTAAGKAGQIPPRPAAPAGGGGYGAEGGGYAGGPAGTPGGLADQFAGGMPGIATPSGFPRPNFPNFPGSPMGGAAGGPNGYQPSGANSAPNGYQPSGGGDAANGYMPGGGDPGEVDTADPGFNGMPDAGTAGYAGSDSANGYMPAGGDPGEVDTADPGFNGMPDEGTAGYAGGDSANGYDPGGGPYAGGGPNNYAGGSGGAAPPMPGAGAGGYGADDPYTGMGGAGMGGPYGGPDQMASAAGMGGPEMGGPMGMGGMPSVPDVPDIPSMSGPLFEFVGECSSCKKTFSQAESQGKTHCPSCGIPWVNQGGKAGTKHSNDNRSYSVSPRGVIKLVIGLVALLFGGLFANSKR